MDQDYYDEELRWRLGLLRTKLEEGKIKFAAHLADEIQQSLGAIRYGTDGKIDLSTVDARVRSLSLAVAGLQQREDAKKAISLQEISRNYFDAIENNFGDLAQKAKELDFNANDAAHAVSQTTEQVEFISSRVPDILEYLENFWTNVSLSSDYHIQDIDGLKAVYGGDLFPSYTNNIASAVGLYTDTVILSDPFLNSRHIFQNASKKQKTYYLIKHALNVLRYKDLATAEVDKPIIVLTPFRSSVNENEEEFLRHVTEVDALRHASVLFDRSFGNSEELWSFGSTLESPEKIVDALATPDRLLFDKSWDGPLKEQIVRGLNSDWNDVGGDNHPGHMVVGMCYGRMGQATDLLLKSRYLSGIPLIEAPTSWEYFNWKLEYNAVHKPEDLTSLHIVKGLQRISETDEDWLGRIPSAALIEMRQQGAFAEIREILSKGVGEIATAKPDGYLRSSDQIVDNIRDAFASHTKEIASLRARGIKFAGHDLGSMIIAGGIDIASIITGTPTFGAASIALNQLIDIPKLREIPERYRELKNAHHELKKSPMGMFFKHK